MEKKDKIMRFSTLPSFNPLPLPQFSQQIYNNYDNTFFHPKLFSAEFHLSTGNSHASDNLQYYFYHMLIRYVS